MPKFKVECKGVAEPIIVEAAVAAKNGAYFYLYDEMDSVLLTGRGTAEEMKPDLWDELPQVIRHEELVYYRFTKASYHRIESGTGIFKNDGPVYDYETIVDKDGQTV